MTVTTIATMRTVLLLSVESAVLPVNNETKDKIIIENAMLL